MRQPFDDIAKAFYRRWFEGWGVAVETERQVFARGRAIDLVVRCTEADLARLQDTVFAHFRQLNSLELKGIHDPLTLWGLNLIMMRVWGLGALKPGEASDKEAILEEQEPVVKQTEREVKRMKPVLTEETWEAIDEFFRQTPEAPEKLPWLQETMQEMMQEAVAESERRTALRTQQQTLVRLLRHKFPEVPDSLAQRIEAMEDPEQLDAWLDPLLDATTLAEVESVLAAGLPRPEAIARRRREGE